MKKFKLLFVSTEQASMKTILFIKLCQNRKQGMFTKINKFYLRNNLHKYYNIIIGDDCSIGSNIYFPHPQNIVIGSQVTIGNNCTLYHDVTLGQNKGRYPVLRDNIIVYPGSKIIGNVYIGNNAIIGANSVVTMDVADYAIVAGNPAHVVGMRNCKDEYY